jgi:hypothetical protein
MPELRSHHRGRSLDQRLFCNSKQRFTTASGEVQAADMRSESDYDFDVIVVQKGRNATGFQEPLRIMCYHRGAHCLLSLHHPLCAE